MSKYCPITKRKVVYLTCMDCDTKVCKGETEEYKTTVKNNGQPPLFPNEIVENNDKTTNQHS